MGLLLYVELRRVSSAGLQVIFWVIDVDVGIFSVYLRDRLTEGLSTPLSSSDVLKSTCSLLTAIPSLISLVGVCSTL